MIATPEVVSLYISVWGATWRGRENAPQDSRLSAEVLSIREARKMAQERAAKEAAITRVSERPTEIVNPKFGYQELDEMAALLASTDPYSGPRPHGMVRTIDDPDLRSFVFLTVECFIQRQRDAHQALARHSWVYRRGDRDFRYQLPPELVSRGEPNPVPSTGRSKLEWCKKVRHRLLRPGIQRAIQTHVPESIAERIVMELCG